MEILYEDKDIMVVKKPAGIPVETRNVSEADMVSMLKNHLSRKANNFGPYLGLIHRLDKPVGGILVFALNKEAAAELNRQLTGGDFDKKYHAFVEGIVDTKGEWISLTDYLLKDKDTARVVPKDTKDAKRAELEYKTVKTDEDAGVALLDIKLITGRFHQIRAQLSNMGHPIAGDVKYGSKIREPGTKASIAGIPEKSIGLCAYHLGFNHPRTGERMEFDSTEMFEI
ncbi:MAG: RluA family pseudouridine synthase [Lachnospiraceae bacterium]|nr:RluA family pseudouridine synthase [Lachnospiraceae bacterium]